MELEKLAEPLNKLVDAVRSGIGTLYEPTAIRKKAEAEADALIVSTNAEIQATDIRHRALVRLTEQETRRQLNMEAIVDKAKLELPDSVSADKVSEDWIVQFFENCRDVSAEQAQNLWGKILAREVEKPGRFSIRTLETLRTISSREADCFLKFCAMVFIDENGYGIHIPLEPSLGLEQFNITYLDLVDLESLGLVRIGPSNLKIVGDYSPQEFTFDGKKYYLYPHDFENGTVLGDLVVLTNSGNSLFPIIDPTPNLEYLKLVFDNFSKLNLYVSTLPPKIKARPSPRGQDRTAYLF